jgi:hypothetical protein
MKIWFDLSNAPHINLFKDLLKDFEEAGHEVIVTCRPLSNTISLLDLHKIRYTVVGKHYGKNFYFKIFGYPIRVKQLYNFLKPLKVDVAISQSSFHSPVVARLLRIPSIYMNDNEHALGNIPSFICATRVFIPEFLSIDKVRKQGANMKKIVSYPGVKEGIYLWQSYLNVNGGHASDRLPAPKIYVRPEPRTAQYYKGGLNFLDDVIIALKDKVQIIILTRDKEQFNHYRTSPFHGVVVPDTAISFNDIAKDCSLFIGAGGTMTREMAVVGVPTISVYQDTLLDVDKYLIEQGLMLHMPSLKAENILECIDKNNNKSPNKTLLLKGKNSYNLIKTTVQEIANTAVGQNIKVV